MNSLNTAPTSTSASQDTVISSIQSQSSFSASENGSHSSCSPPMAISRSEASSLLEATGCSPATNSQESSYVRFECGCDQCSVYDYISGKNCPTPIVLKFPKLEVSEIPPEEIELIEEKLKKQTKQIHYEFCRLVSDTFKELRSNVDHTELMSHLKLLLKSPYQSSSTVTYELDDVIISDLPTHLMDRCYYSWFDYDLIEKLREYFLYPNEDKALSDYKNCLHYYVHHRCFIHFHNTGPLPKKCVEVKCKVDLQYDKLSKEKIKTLRLAFNEIIGVSQYHLVFMRASRGCTELTFGAPPYFSEITKLSKYQISQLKDHGFIQVTINGKIFLSAENQG